MQRRVNSCPYCVWLVGNGKKKCFHDNDINSTEKCYDCVDERKEELVDDDKQRTMFKLS